MESILIIVGFICVGFVAIRLGMNAQVFHQADKAQPDEGWSVLGLAAKEPLINTMICGFLIAGAINSDGMVIGLILVTLLLATCVKLAYEANKHKKLTLHVMLSIARIASAALSLSALTLYATNDTTYEIMAGISICIAGITVLLTLITMSEGWWISQKWKTAKFKVV